MTRYAVDDQLISDFGYKSATECRKAASLLRRRAGPRGARPRRIQHLAPRLGWRPEVPPSLLPGKRFGNCQAGHEPRPCRRRLASERAPYIKLSDEKNMNIPAFFHSEPRTSAQQRFHIAGGT
ncbi:hypothetical protein CEXT_171591 [Caerostris extrusa]|uniref:Uncharacterized protein n=1 Tax=Caerostris extrusa TaxID=172846 RepID=A0AAV4S675_CAEEX|nr:hypothetical protein CEXT_171591 [Caerostris extrusa]